MMSSRPLPAKSVLSLLALSCCLVLSAQEKTEASAPCMVETSLWSLMNLAPDSPDFYQLGLAYALDEKGILSLAFTTWKYPAPLGIPWGPSFGSKAEEYPGFVRAFGLGMGYQRFLWQGLFVSVHATPFLQDFHDSAGRDLGSGFQLYLQAQLGCQVALGRSGLYLKPSLSFNHWPVNTGFPEAFQAKERNWPNYFLFEPHLNIGFRF